MNESAKLQNVHIEPEKHSLTRYFICFPTISACGDLSMISVLGLCFGNSSCWLRLGEDASLHCARHKIS